MTQIEPKTADLVAHYAVLTKETMPELARTTHRHWPVKNDHCFQRIVLDTVCGCVWYDHLARPAYKHLTRAQAMPAVSLCGNIIDGTADLNVLNKRSLVWLGKLG